MDKKLNKYLEIYKKQLDSDNTIECITCGSLLLGNEPKIVIQCFNCYNKIKGE